MKRAAPVLLLIACLAPAGAAAGILDELREGFRYRVETLAHDTFIELEPKGADPENLLGFPQHELGLDLRPDLTLDVRRLSLMFEPRYGVRHARYERGFRAGTDDTDDDLFVHQWEVRLRLTDVLQVSTGRLDLQWGPSYLLSPSNPFNRSNGRNDPQVEEPGLEFSQLSWTPAYRWSFTFIANTGEGRLGTGPGFSPRYALKADFLGDGWFAGAVGSVTEENQDPVIGGYAGWTVSDAVLLHAEAATGADPDGSTSVDRGDYLLGGSYAFPGGAFAVVEYFRDGTGCDEADIADCFNPFVSDPADPADLFFRSRYLLLQFTHPSWHDQLLWTARWIRGLDDGSSRVIGILQWDATDHLQPFFTGVADLGDPRDEYGSVVRAAVRVGAAVVF